MNCRRRFWIYGLAAALLTMMAVNVSARAEEWKSHEVRILGEMPGGDRMPAKLQIVTESWNRVVAVPYIVYIPEKDRLLMLVSCDYPHRPMVLTSFDRGATWSQPQPVLPDEPAHARHLLGVSLTYLGDGQVLCGVEGRLRCRSIDYGQIWSSEPIPPNPHGGGWNQWDPYLVYRETTTGRVTQVIETGYRGSTDGGQEAFLRSSPDRGKNWNDATRVPQWAKVSEVALVRAANGHIVAACRTDIPPSKQGETLDHFEGLGVSISADEGRTWSEVRKLFDWGRHHPSLVVMPKGDIVMTYVVRKGYIDTEDGFPQFGIEAVVSRDHGKSWDLDHRYLLHTWVGNRKGSNQSAPGPQAWWASSQATSTVLLPDGNLLTAFGTGYRSQPNAQGMSSPRDVGLIQWRLSKNPSGTSSRIRDAAPDSDLRNWLDPRTGSILAEESAGVLHKLSKGFQGRVEPIEMGTRLEPLVDDYLIANLHNVKQTRHEPIRREVAIVNDSPWEGNLSGYHVVFQDGDRYRMYYRGWKLDGKSGKFSSDYTCYAESSDGIRWTKPNLGLYEFQGSKQNNIVWKGEGTHAFAPFKDTNPACKPEQQYKAVGPIMGTPQKQGGLGAFQSPDGLHWSPLQEKPVITKGAFDSLNLAFWDATRQRYVDFHRDTRHGRRAIVTCTSTDFVHWTDPVWLEYPGAAEEELYTNAVIPYQRAPHLFLGFPMRYVRSRTSQTMEGIPPIVGFTNPEPGSLGLTDAVFMTSRDGVNFRRRSEAFIRPGLGKDCWISRNNAPAWGIVETKSDTSEGIPELSIYATESYFNNATRLRRFSMRMDGFVSVRADSQGGEMLTRPIVFSGKRLEINFSTSAVGSIQVELQDASGKPIPGFVLEDCPEIYGDRIRQVVAWKQGSDVSQLAGQPIRLRFVMKDADLYAIQFP